MGHFRILLYIEAQYPWSSKYSFTCGDQWNGLFGVKQYSDVPHSLQSIIILLFCSLGAKKYDVVDQF